MRQCRDDALCLTDAEAQRGYELVNACLDRFSESPAKDSSNLSTMTTAYSKSFAWKVFNPV